MKSSISIFLLFILLGSPLYAEPIKFDCTQFMESTNVAGRLATPNESCPPPVSGDIKKLCESIDACLSLGTQQAKIECIKKILGEDTWKEVMCVINISNLVDAVKRGSGLTQEVRGWIEFIMANCPSGDGVKCGLLTLLARIAVDKDLKAFLNIKAGQACCGVTPFGDKATPTY